MNPLRELTPLTGVGGTQIVAGTATSTAAIDWTPNYEPRVGVVLGMGAAVAALTSCTATVQESADGTNNWTTVGTVVSDAGTSASGQTYYAEFPITKRYLAATIEMAGAGGTALGGVTLLAKPRSLD